MEKISVDEKRYKRHIMLPEIGEEGQKKLAESRVLVVGAGGLGSPVCLYLAAAGIGTIGIADFDTVDVSNLQRQVLYRESDVGRPKAEAAAERLRERNSQLTVEIYPEGLTEENVDAMVSRYDVVVDATDNFHTRYLLNDAAVRQGKPEVYGAICEYDGQVTVFSPEGPCLRCLNPEQPAQGEGPNAADYGVLGVLPGMIGCIQAEEVIKLLLGFGEALIGRMLFLDTKTMTFDEMELRKNPRCPVCGRVHRDENKE
ncbi:MAG: HesA/MoeB/ThiF family protein [Clostridiaceae bacterium]|nr:HesA/MoeB/ThiF family protein [Clostridiaceae bacterium]